MKKIVRALIRINYIKSLLLNFACFDFRTAIRMPVLLGYGIKIDQIYRGG